MKQQINLYQVEKKKMVIQFTFFYMIVIVGSFLSILFLITAYNLFNHLTIKKELTVLGKEQIAKSQKLQIIAGQVPEEQTRNQIISEIKKYEVEKQQKEEILSLLTTAQISKIKGFSEFLGSLAKGSVSGLWLTRFVIKDNGDYIALEGKALRPEYVTSLISGLSQEAIFSGKSFQLFKVALDDKTKQVIFTLETKAHEQP